MKHGALKVAAEDEMYFLYDQMPGTGISLAVRSAGDLEGLCGTIHDSVWALGRDLPLSDFRTMQTVPDSAAARQGRHRVARGCQGASGDGRDSNAILHAYDAAYVSRELHSAAFGPVGAVRHAAVGGRVYIGEKGAVYVYGVRDRTAR